MGIKRLKGKSSVVVSTSDVAKEDIRLEYQGMFSIIPSWGWGDKINTAINIMDVLNNSSFKYEIVVTKGKFYGLKLFNNYSTIEECLDAIEKHIYKYSEASFLAWAEEFVSERGFVTPHKHIEHVRSMMEKQRLFGIRGIQDIINSQPKRGFIPKGISSSKFKPVGTLIDKGNAPVRIKRRLKGKVLLI